MPRTMEIEETTTVYDARVLEQEGKLRHHSTFNINTAPNRDHPLVVLYPTAKEHFHNFLLLC